MVVNELESSRKGAALIDENLVAGLNQSGSQISLSMCCYRCLCVVYRCLCVVYLCLCVVYVFLDAATLTEVFPRFFSVVRQMPGYN